MGNAKKLRIILELLMGFRWNRSLICAVGSDKFNDLLSIVKSSDLSEGGVGKLRKLVLGHFPTRPDIRGFLGGLEMLRY